MDYRVWLVLWGHIQEAPLPESTSITFLVLARELRDWGEMGNSNHPHVFLAVLSF